jgi:hypothetical protein
MADEARLNEILDIIEQARAEGDSATEQKAIAAYKRETAPVDDPSRFGGAGGYNPMLGRLMGAQQAVAAPLGITGQNTANPIANAAGPLEAIAQAGTGAAAMPVAGLAGIGQGVFNQLFPDPSNTSAEDRVSKVQQAMTYQPRTGMGAGTSAVAGAPGALYDSATTRAGEFTTDATGSPTAGAAIKTLLGVVPWSAAARAAPKGPLRSGDYTPTKNDVPTTAALTNASRAAYKAGEESGVIVPVEGYSKALTKVQNMVKEEGIDPTLHPKSLAVMKRLEEANGKPLTLKEAETLRKIALDAEDDLNPVTRQATPDARIAGKIVDELDDSIDALSVNNPARELWGRSRRSQMIDRAIERAETKAGAHFTQAGMEHALRQEFKQLALNERRMRGLTAEQKAAIKKVAAGGPLENTLRALGKFDPTSSPVAAISSLGTGALMTPFTGGVSAALPVAGFLSKRAATAMTKANVEKAREALVGRGTTSGGLLSKENPTPLVGGQQGLLSGSAARAPATVRTAEQVRADIAQLTARVQSDLETESAGSPKVQAAIAELQSLQRELAATQAN